MVSILNINSNLSGKKTNTYTNRHRTGTTFKGVMYNVRKRLLWPNPLIYVMYI